MGTNSTGCAEWERDYDPITEQPRGPKMTETNWIRLAKEIRNIPGGIATLRVLQAHDLTHIVKLGERGISKSNSIENVIDRAHREQ